jgi:hypothetical protein
MSPVQNVTIAPKPDGNLGISWEVLADHKAISVQVARAPEMAGSTMRHFVLPAGVKGCTLDLGPGTWGCRVGAWIGDANRGAVEWSGIYGPVAVASPRPLLGVVAERIKVVHVQSLEGGMRFHTGRMEEYYTLIESARTEGVRWNYVRDNGMGYIDAINLERGSTYSFRLYDCGPRLPEGALVQLGEGIAVRGKRALPSGPSLNVVDYSEHKAERAVLRDSVDRPAMRFPSQADYLKFVAAKAKTTAARERA